MKVLVLGAGVVGTTTAYYLNKAGHDVTVVERQDSVGMETSFANGGQIAAAHANPWASPATPFKALKWLGKKDAPLLFHFMRLDPALWGWGLKFLANCTENKTDINTERTLRIALHSRKCLKELRKEIELHYDHREEGILHFYRNEKEFALAVKAAQTMRKYGLDRRIVDSKTAVTIEPALKNVQSDIVGAIYSSDDESGDAHKFTRELAKHCEARGVEFLYNRKIENLQLEQGKVFGVKTDHGILKADTTVVCLGSFSAPFLKPYGLHLPIYPAKGYSITLPLSSPEKAPSVSLTDDEFKLVISRFENRLRIAGTAELGGYSTDLNDVRTNFILQKALELFPGCADANDAIRWAGLRPKTPDSVPIIGTCALDSLFLNTGHGTLGWTMSCGSAQVLADIISKKTPEIKLSGLGLERF